MSDLKPLDTLTLLTCREMARADAYAIAHGVFGGRLMERAGRAVAEEVRGRHPRQPVIVLCGPGNNGGDGFVAARHLKEAGWPVRVALAGRREALRGDAADAAARWDGPVQIVAPELLEGSSLVVDALFGAGLARPLDGAIAATVERVNASGKPVIAVDVPSGLHGDSGEILGAAIRASSTVTFFRGKPGHYSANGLRLCGRLRIADIGIPAAAVGEIGPRLWLNAPALWDAALHSGGVDDHKYARGHLSIVGGRSATGAARLAALAARRAGVGLVTIVSPTETLGLYRAAEPGNLVVAADDSPAFATLLEDTRRSAFVVGPGSGLEERTRAAVFAILAARRSAVLDADALTLFADAPRVLFDRVDGPVLLTPHEGEFRRLFPDLAGGGKVERVRAAARRSGATVLLKGPDTVIAAPDGRCVVNVHASPGLATAGSGDVLAGIAGSLAAQGMSMLAAAAAASWIHGDCALRYGRTGLIAEDLPAVLPAVLDGLFAMN